jgi:hypothetical protein
VTHFPAFPAGGTPGSGDIAGEELIPLLDAALGVWSSPGERRRMRAFGSQPSASDPSVLRRDWHGVEVRVGPGRLWARRRGEQDLLGYEAGAGALLLNGEPFEPRPSGLALAESLVELIQAYERWVEAREGREGRLGRGHWSGPDRRPINALAETRRVQRLLHGGWRPSRRRTR